MEFRKILWSIIKTVFRIIGKLLLLGAWGVCEFLAVAFRALSTWLKKHITQTRT